MTEIDPKEMLEESIRLIKELDAENELLRQKNVEEIAIIGMSCRFPGGANSPEAFWELLHRGGDAISEVPESRWDADSYYDPDPEAPGKMITKLGGFLDFDVSLFDAEFFGISPREAEFMDPQQRLLLELSYEAIESAGIEPAALKGSQTGVFIGIGSHDYMDLLSESSDSSSINPYLGTGNAASVASGRISYVFDFQGPTFSVDTACSSSLVAIDQACESLHSGTCDLALAGGVNLILSPNVSVGASKAGMLSPDGRCKTFDANANGYVRGEGCGVIVLKRYSEALRDGNRILALIKSSGINQDGASSGLTVPNKIAQEALINSVLGKAKLKGSDIDYIELHGTGTPLGDPIEVRAIESTYGVRDPVNPVILASVKTNIGHLEAAAGIAGVIKTVLALQHETIPPHLHLERLNPHIEMDFPSIIVTENRPWKRGEKTRRAAVSSFGFSGTNAHLILEEAPPQASVEAIPKKINPRQFQRKRYWAEGAIPGAGTRFKSVHPLLGEMRHNPNDTISFYGEFKFAFLPYLKEHQVYDYIIYPGAGYLEMMLGAARHAIGTGVIELTKVSIESVLYLPVGKTIGTQLLMSPVEAGYEVEIFTQERQGPWNTHVKGLVSLKSTEQDLNSIDIEVLKSRFVPLVSKDEFYTKVNSSGVHYGNAFQTLIAIYTGNKEALGELRISVPSKGYLAHPTLLDGSFQLSAVSLFNENIKDVYLPIGCDSFKLYADLEDHIFTHWQETESTDSGLSGNLRIISPTGKLLAAIEGIHYRKTTEHIVKNMLSGELSADQWMYEWMWQEHIIEEVNAPVSVGHWLILGDEGLAKKITGLIESKGGSCRIPDHVPKTKEEFAALIDKENYDGIVHLTNSANEGELSSAAIHQAQSFGVKSFLYLKQALIMLNRKIPLFLINTIILENSPLNGFFKTALLEHPDHEMKHIQLGDDWEPEALLKALFAKDDESIVAIHGAEIQVPRLIGQNEAKTKRHELILPTDTPFTLKSKENGLLENLTLVPLDLKDTLGPNDVEVELRAAAINFRDVLTALDALGMVENADLLGGDGSGIVTRVGESVKNVHAGDAVLGLMSGTFATKSYAHQDTITPKPSNLTFEEAAALPTVFLTVQYAFTRSTQLKPSDTVLIHAGAGGVGQAAIQLAKLAGATIIATAGDERKRDFLRAQGIQHVFDSRHLSFGDAIKNATGGSGVDVVLNCLSGDGFIETSLSVCKPGARFLEIGKRNIWTKEQMQNFRPDIDYHVIALDKTAMTQPQIIKEMLHELMPLFAQGKLTPVPFTSFPIEKSIQAFEYMKSARHIGKVVITLPLQNNAKDKIRPDATYLITGGLGALGQALTKFLVQKGARHIVLTGRRKADQKLIDTLKISDVALSYVALDVSDEPAVKNLIEQLTHSVHPLKGIFHLAAVLDDALLMEQDWPHFETVFAPKVYGSFNLHHYSQELDFFVLYSSAASVLGSPGQSNYAAANAFMDALCEYRKAQGLPAQSLSWGPWSEIGLAKDLVSRHATKGVIALNPSEGMRAFEAAFSQPSVHTLIANINRKLILKQMFFIPSWLKGFEDKKDSKSQLSVKLEVLDVGERLTFITNYVEDTVKEVLGIGSSRSIDQKKGFASMGLDSMLAVELKNRLQAGIGKEAMLATTAIFDHSTVEKLSQYIAHLLKVENIQVRKRQQALIAVQPEEPIAIIGMSCRFPGGANNPEAFWDLLYRGGDAISEVPASRFDVDSYYDPDPEAPGKMITKRGGFLDIDIGLFDAEFFGISPREAEFMDPQQRLLLELSYEAMESAGIEPASLQGTQTGVFIGISSHDYNDLLNQSGDNNLLNPYMGTGNAASTASGRISYVFDFQGPNFAIDTACSSSLVAIDQACESLRNGSCNLALSGGVNLLIAPQGSIAASKAGMLSPDGLCKTFDASADGFVRGEGCGIIVLKRYSDALRDGNPIFAVIKASSINQDGASSGLTVPNGEAQEALINHVLAKAKLKGSDIDYVEAHGTGTSLGDPIEVRAIGSTYGIRDAENPLRIGSVKTNIGHLEAAAGVAGVIKTVLALQNETIPCHLHFHQFNPHIENNFPVEVVTRNQEWKRGEKPRRASVSSFGFSGTNAHLIIEEAPQETTVPAKIQNRHQFQRKRYWVESASPGASRKPNTVHPLLGQMRKNPNDTISFDGELQFSALPYLKDHQVYDYMIYPGAGYLEMMLAAAWHGVGEGIIELTNVSIESALNLPVGKKTDTHLLMSPLDSGYEVTIYTQESAGSWDSHATGKASTITAEQEMSSVDIEALKSRLTVKITKEEFYTRINSKGIKYGPSFQTLDLIHVGKQEALGELTLSVAAKGYFAHPALLDGCLQLLALSMPEENTKDIYMPIGCDSFKLYAPLGDPIFAYWQETEKTDFGRSGNFQMLSPNGSVLAEIRGMHYRKTNVNALKHMLGGELSTEAWMYESIWQEYVIENAVQTDPMWHWLILGDETIAKKMTGLLESRGGSCQFISTADIPKSKEEFVEILDKENPTAILFLSSSVQDEDVTVDNILQAQVFGSKSFLHLTQAIVQLNRNISLYLINDTHLANSPLNGLFKTAFLEHPEIEMKYIALEKDWLPEILLNILFSTDQETIFALRDGRIYVPRVINQKEAKVKRHELTRPVDDQFRLQSKEKGLLENLTLVPLDIKDTLAPDEVEIDIRAAGINFRDVLDALGLYPGVAGPLGGDGSGVVTRVGQSVKDFHEGDTVFGLMSGAFARKAYTHHAMIALKPSRLTFEEAAALPTIFLTAYYAFSRSTKLKPSDTVLIHAGAVEVGQAAIQLAKLFGAKIIATADDEGKRDFLKAQGVEHVFDSSSLSFREDIKNLTDGHGVDVVLSCLTGEGFIEASLGVCNEGARFLEISKINIWTNEQMQAHRPDIDYHLIALDNTAVTQPQIIKEMLDELLPLFEQGKLSSVPITTYPVEKAIQAFEFVKSAKHIGKVVITLPPQLQLEDRLSPDATYLITGGLGGIGQVLTKFLARKGARHIVLTGRRKSEEGLLKDLDLAEVAISYESLDISDEQAVVDLLNRLNGSVHPLKGIFHLAAILDDGLITDQNWSRFETVFAPKVYGSFYLHQYSKDLDFFVLFSSVASVFGSPGQSNYAAANSFMDALCQYRNEKGLAALSLSWGPWSEIGLAKDLVSRHATKGLIAMSPKDGMRTFEAALSVNSAHATLVNVNRKIFSQQMINTPSWLKSFEEQKASKSQLSEQLEVIDAGERLNNIKKYVSESLKEVLGISTSRSIDEKKGFATMGLDSMLAVELKKRLQTGIGKQAIIATTAIFDYSTVEKLSEYIAQLLKVENIQVRKHSQALISVQTDEPIAIIGMSCRFPGGSNDPEAFWEFLHQGKDGIVEVPPSRWDADSYYDPDPEAPGKMITKLGGFLDIDVSLFDAEFFGISPREAEFMDPQQRLLLEVTYEAIESADIEPASLEGTQTGVFIGMFNYDYGSLLRELDNKTLSNPYLSTGNVASATAGRISHIFDFQGPCLAIDTACSSSLVAIDQACISLRNGTVSLAVAGGVNLMLSPDTFVVISKAHMLSPDGHCKTFDAGADGYARGEGCGVILLKRYSEAVRDGNPILGLIKSSGVNQDGASSGLTVPNGEAQEALINHVLAKARLKGSDIDYVEAHGTGTSLGDPIEVRAIGSTYGIRDSNYPLRLGSVKTNIGHTEGAAGIAGVIKAVLALRHESIPANLHFHQLNPYIELNFPVEIVTKNQTWKRGEKTRRAAVSSFGFSGTNAHLILEEAPLEAAVAPAPKITPRHQFQRKRFWFEKAIPIVEKQVLSPQLSKDEWMYEWVWQELNSEQIVLPTSFGHWLILSDDQISLIQLVQSKGGSCRAVELPKSKEELLGLLEKENPAGVFHLAMSRRKAELTTDVIRSAQGAGSQTFLQLVQALSLHEPKIPVILITDDSLENSPLNGLFKTASIEHPEIPMRHIQLGAGWSHETLLNVIFTRDEEEIFRLKEGKIYVPRLARQATGDKLAPEVHIRPDATYLVTGGLGGLGQAVARFLVHKGARHIILTGRRKSEEILKIDDATLTYESLDISDELSVQDLMNRLSQSPHPLKGIFHLAGVTDRALLIDQNWPRYEKVFAPKVYGSFYLHHYSKDLDFFVMFSSIASSLGIQGQSNYSAANAFMDALCVYRKQMGMPALSISWGPWSEVGMGKGLDDDLAKGGLLTICPREGIGALEKALTGSNAHLTITHMNWKVFLKQMIILPSWLKAFAEQGISKETLSAQLESIPLDERLNFIKGCVSTHVKEVLKIAPNDPIDVKKGFVDLGFDSLMAIELKNTLQAAIGKQAILPTTALFDYATIEKLSEYIAKLLKVENIHLRKRQALISVQSDEPIAIIGMSCRFPGGANNPEAFWELLHQGRDGIVEVPPSRWDADSYYDPDRAAPGKMITKRGGFLDIDVGLFDAEFFGISPREAEFMDPQHRLLLELTFEAMESAGIESSSLQGTQTGVFVGISSHDYSDLLSQSGGENSINPYLGTGNASSTATGRISYVFDFQGPNFAVDTACSSSLVAIDQACTHLRTGAATVAFAGGVNLLLSPFSSITASKAGMLSPEGTCKTFDESADGFARGEGCGIIVLKRYADAIRDGNRVLALIKASAINQDGASSGLTVPNGEAQEALINHVLAKAKLKGSDIDYIEAHGTGTPLGDPIEVRAIGSTYGVRDPANPLRLGSVKTNIGHLEAAAGIAGVIKAVLALQHETIPPHLHFKHLNPHIEMNFPVAIVTSNQEWKRGEKTRRAAVSSFGFSGTNAHLIIEEAPQEAPVAAATVPARHQFQRKRFWAEGAVPTDGRRQNSVHPLLGEMLTLPNDMITYFGSLQIGQLPYLKEHQVYDYTIYPGAGFLEMMLAAATLGFGTESVELNHVSIESALNLPAGKKISTQVLMSPEAEVTIYTRSAAGAWDPHASGEASINQDKPSADLIDIEALKARCATVINKEEFYNRVNSGGLKYGKAFQTLQQIYVGNKEALGELKSSVSVRGYHAHPTLLDGCLQLLAISFSDEKETYPYLPVGCDSFKLYAPLKDHIFAHWQESEITDTGRSGHLQIFSPEGQLLAEIVGMHYRKTTEQAIKHALGRELSTDEWMYEWMWQEQALEKSKIPDPLGHWLILGDEGVARKVIGLIESKGGSFRSISIADLPKDKRDLLSLLEKEQPAGIVHIVNPSKEGELTSQTIQSAQDSGSKVFLHLIQGLVALNSKIRLLLINAGNLENSPLNGLFKTALLEHPEIEMKQMILGVKWEPEILLNTLFANDDEAILLLKDNKIYVPRLQRQSVAKTQRKELTRPIDDQFRLQSREKGLLANLMLVPLEVKEKLAPYEIEIDVRAVGLNFRDVLDALALYPGDPGPLGADGCGVITRVGELVTQFHEGDTVFGLMRGALSRKALSHSDLIAFKPANLSFEEAAALPTVFLTAYYAFTRSTQLKPGDTVLIHAGAGGVGQAAIQLAKLTGATIIATAGDEKKREFLKAQGIQHVFDSRQLSFGADIMKATNGSGIDVVLNSLSGEGFIETSLSVCKQKARFLEIGKRNIWTKEQMHTHRPDIDYHVIALDDLALAQPGLIQEMLGELLPLFAQENLVPIPITCFPIERSIQAFEYMKAAKHTGKVVITLPPQLLLDKQIHPDATYLITGGLGGIGQVLTQLLVQKGARHILLIGRSKPDQELIDNLKIPEIAIEYESLDISDEQSVKHLIERLAGSAHPLKGIFHLAGALDDAVLKNQDWSRFEKVFAPKVYGSYYLHQYSKNLDFFVLFSSAASVLGSPGQSNYAAANAFMDALCEYRRGQGLPALSLSFGPWSTVGMAKDLISRHTKSGVSAINIKEGIRALEAAMIDSQAHITIANINWKIFLKQMIVVPSWLKVFAEQQTYKGGLLEQLETIDSSQRFSFLKDYVSSIIKNLIGVSPLETLDENKGFADMGFDSLMTVELKNRLQSSIGKAFILPSSFVFDYPTLGKLTNQLLFVLKVGKNDEENTKQKNEEGLKIKQEDELIKKDIAKMDIQSIADLINDAKSGDDQ